MDLEAKIKKLQEIVSKIETPDMGVDECMKLYEEGILLAKECYKEVDAVKGKINIIKQDLEQFREESFE
ncbi:MAG: exodeoxyribonuclease VII small subunit [Clostridiales bacterium]|nr:exodeoxyribonuclease VII small subunit [Clostridiales bacterium]